MTRARLVLVGLAIATLAAACGGSTTTTTMDPAELVPGDIARGADVYKGTCATCHGGDAKGINGLGKPLVGSDFVVAQTEENLALFIKQGRTKDDPENMTGIAMPPSGGNNGLSTQDLYDVAAYLISLNP